MESTRETSSDASSEYEEFIEMDVKEDGAEMSDSEVKMELDMIQRWSVALGQKNTTSVKSLSNTPLATPKIQSVVVIPESASNCSTTAGCQPKVKLDRVTKAPKRRESVHNKANKSDKSSSSLMALFSKGKPPARDSAPKPGKKPMDENSVGTPASSKRIRSTGTTPEEVHKRPDKLTKLQGGSNSSTPESTARSNLLEQRTLNLKVCASNRQLTGQELQIVKKFFIYQIEQALVHQNTFIPIFTEPSKIDHDGLYVFCADQKCAQWVTYIASTGIPEIPGKLVTLPHTTPVQLNPDFVNVRVVTTIPTRKPKEEILNDLVQLNKDLNVEKWGIHKIRPKGSCSSTVYMRMDKTSFDTITARDESSRINWIFGPIEIRKEEHKPRPKKHHPASEMDKSKAVSNLRGMAGHFKPPSSGSVDSTPRGTRLDRNGYGKSEPKFPIQSTKPQPKTQLQPKPKGKEKSKQE